MQLFFKTFTYVEGIKDNNPYMLFLFQLLYQKNYLCENSKNSKEIDEDLKKQIFDLIEKYKVE